MLKGDCRISCHPTGKIIRSIVLLLLLFLLPNGCGRKAPPVAPGVDPPPVIADLTGNVDNNILTLNWSIALKSLDAHPDIKGFYLYQTVTSSEEPACADCPKKFRRIARIPIFPKRDMPGERRQWTYQLPFASGSKPASFKVNIIFSSYLGSDSNILEIEE